MAPLLFVPHALEQFSPKCVAWRWELPWSCLRGQRRTNQWVYSLPFQQNSPEFVFLHLRPPCKISLAKTVHLPKKLETPVATLAEGTPFFNTL